jgi:spore coat polysaccharide biosynthesis protein SpsF
MADVSIVGIVQARMGSKRLPGKVIMPMAGAPLLVRLVDRLRTSRTIKNWIVATTRAGADDAIESLCAGIGCDVYRGSEDDVLSRSIEAANRADAIVRLTADNPFVDGELVDRVAGEFVRMWPDIDYVANVDSAGFPTGLYVEAVSVSALRRAWKDGTPEDKEHVTLHLRRNRDRFRTFTVMAEQRLPDGSLTIDTPSDYAALSVMFDKLYRENPCFSWRAAALAEVASGGDGR